MIKRIAAGVCSVVLVLLAANGAQASRLAAPPASPRRVKPLRYPLG
jgi:hypothetical protein